MSVSQPGSVTCSFFNALSDWVGVLTCLGLPHTVFSLNSGIFISPQYLSQLILYLVSSASPFLKWLLQMLFIYCLDCLLKSYPSSLPSSISSVNQDPQLLDSCQLPLYCNSDLNNQFVLCSRQLFLYKGFWVHNRSLMLDVTSALRNMLPALNFIQRQRFKYPKRDSTCLKYSLEDDTDIHR